jgi:hypothetical protein
MLKIILDAQGLTCGYLYVHRDVNTLCLSTSLPTTREPDLVGSYAVLPASDVDIATRDDRLPDMIMPDKPPEEKPDA